MYNSTIPWSCCDGPKYLPCTSTKVHPEGCANELRDFIVYAGKLLGGIAIGIAAVEVSYQLSIFLVFLFILWQT